MLLSKTDVSTFRYREYRNCLQRLIRKNRQDYLLGKCKEFRQNGRKLWQLINRIIGKENNKLNTIEFLKVDNITKYNGDSIASCFNDFFSSVGENLEKQQFVSQVELKHYMKALKSSETSIFMQPTSSMEIHNLLESLPNKTSSGYDNISNILFKSLSKTIITPLEIIFNKSIEEGIFPFLHGNTLNWLKSYLSNRLIRTKCQVASSEQIDYSQYQPIKYGTPQGSCLGPLLFLIFTNDLPTQLHHCSSILFTDDTTLYKSHRNLTFLQWCIQDDMNRLMKYFRINKLTLNLSKTVCVLLQKNKQSKEITLQLDTHTIKNSPEAKFLGMTLDQNLNWSSHLNQLFLKLNRNLNLLKLSRNMMNRESKLLVYCSHLESHIQYGILLWGNGTGKEQINILKKKQNKAFQYVTNKRTALENKKELGVLNINSMIELANLKFGYKALHHLLPPITTEICMSDSRNNPLTKNHKYDTRYKRTPYLPKNASKQYIDSFLC